MAKIISPKGELIKKDWKAIGKKALYALGPYIVVIIPVLIQQLPQEWIYAPTFMWVLNRLKDVIVYLMKETTYAKT